MTDAGLYSDYFMYVAPAIGLTIFFVLLTLAAVLITARVERRRMKRDIYLHLDEKTREQVRTWRSEVRMLKAENARLRKRCSELAAMVRGAQSVLSGLEAETPNVREDNDGQ